MNALESFRVVKNYQYVTSLLPLKNRANRINYYFSHLILLNILQPTGGVASTGRPLTFCR